MISQGWSGRGYESMTIPASSIFYGFFVHRKKIIVWLGKENKIGWFVGFVIGYLDRDNGNSHSREFWEPKLVWDKRFVIVPWRVYVVGARAYRLWKKTGLVQLRAALFNELSLEYPSQWADSFAQTLTITPIFVSISMIKFWGLIKET